MKLKYLFVLTPFLLAACGEPQPSKDDLSKDFNDKYTSLNLESIDLKKTEQKGDLILYAAEGKFKTTNDLYERLDGMTYGEGPEYLKLVEKSGKTYDFTASVVASGNDKTGWKVDINKLHSKLPEYHTLTVNIDVTDPNVLVINADDFQEKMTKLESISNEKSEKMTANEAKIKTLEAEITSLNEQRNKYWETLEIDGNKFGRRWDVEKYLNREVEAYKDENKPYKFESKYNREVYDQQKKEVYKNTKSYEDVHYAEIRAERDRVFKENREKFDAGLVPLEAEAKAKLQKYLDEYDAFSTKTSELQKQMWDLQSESRTLEREIKSFERFKKLGIEKGYLK